MTPARQLLHQLAASGHRAPIGTHLILHEKPEASEIVLDGQRLGEVIVEAAQRFGTPLAIPLMDLTLEKEALLLALGVEPEKIPHHHLTEPPATFPPLTLTPRMSAACEAIRHAASKPDLLPIGMGIGPFSLMTKLVADPITPVFLAGAGSTAEEEPELAVVEAAIQAGLRIILEYIEAQARAGARAFILCEPAANTVYFSPNQLEETTGHFERLVMAPLREVRARMRALETELIFHDCGELSPMMVRAWASLDSAMLSLGSSRDLPADASLVPPTTVLYGNLPTKKFISPQLTEDEVRRMAAELAERMGACGHPFILGSECDVLAVEGRQQEILSKVRAFLG